MKDTLEDLAVLGARAAFDSPIVFGRPNIGSRQAFYDRLESALDSRWLSNGGPLCEEFERRVAAQADVEDAVATCNATAALQLAVRGVGATGEVIMPAFTFAATAHALSWTGLTPVLCDVDPQDGSLLLSQVESLIGPRTSAILGVHLWGRPSRLDELTDLARRHDLALVFDAAHAFGCGWGGRRVGSFGDAEVFSFHATKFINSFEGGALVTSDPELARRARQMRNFGISRDDTVVSTGTNAKMHEASAAMGLTSLDDLDRFVSRNRENYLYYVKELADVPGLRLIGFDEGQANNFQYVVLDVDAAVTGIGRDDLLTLLKAENVIARRYFYPGCHRMEPYRTGRPFPGTDAIAARTLALPTGECVTPGDIAAIGSILRLAASRGHELRRRLAVM